jgi:hypothetical protein
MKRLIIVCILLSSIFNYGMKRQIIYKQEPYNHKKRKFEKPLIILPQDMRNIIFDIITHNPDTRKPREAAKTIRALSVTCKTLNAKINTPSFSDSLINHLSFKYGCSHESICKFLSTKQAKERLMLQSHLKTFCVIKSYNIVTLETLNSLIEKGIDLEFIYNHKGFQKTALMISIDTDVSAFKLLIEANANINGYNTHGMTLLHFISIYPMSLQIYHIIAKPNLNFNQQNIRGETALLRCLKNRRKSHITNHFIDYIDLLLTKIDPEIVDKQGISPLVIAQELDSYRILQAIDRAIQRKHKN